MISGEQSTTFDNFENSIDTSDQPVINTYLFRTLSFEKCNIFIAFVRKNDKNGDSDFTLLATLTVIDALEQRVPKGANSAYTAID